MSELLKVGARVINLKPKLFQNAFHTFTVPTGNIGTIYHGPNSEHFFVVFDNYNDFHLHYSTKDLGTKITYKGLEKLQIGSKIMLLSPYYFEDHSFGPTLIAETQDVGTIKDIKFGANHNIFYYVEFNGYSELWPFLDYQFGKEFTYCHGANMLSIIKKMRALVDQL